MEKKVLSQEEFAATGETLDLDADFLRSLQEPDNVKNDFVASQDKNVILSIRHLKQYFRFGSGIYKYNKAVHDVSFDVHRGEVLGLVGESGCGKTTTGRSIIKLYDITSGSVFFEGKRIGAGTRWNEKEIKFKKKSAENRIRDLKRERDGELDAIDKTDPSVDYQSQKAEIENRYNPRIDNIRAVISESVKVQERKIALAKHDNASCNKDFAKGKVKVVKARFSPILHFAFFVRHSHNLKCASSLYSKLNSYAMRKWRLLSGDLRVQGDVFTVSDKYCDVISEFFGKNKYDNSEIVSFKKTFSNAISEVNSILQPEPRKGLRGSISAFCDKRFLAFIDKLSLDLESEETSFEAPNSSCVKTLESLLRALVKNKLSFSFADNLAGEREKVSAITKKYDAKMKEYLSVRSHGEAEKKSFVDDYSRVLSEIDEAIDQSHFDDVDTDLFARFDSVFLDCVKALPIDAAPAKFVNKPKIVIDYFQEKRIAHNARITSRMQMIFQDPIASLDPRMTVKEIIAEGLTIQGIRNKKFINEKVNSVLKEVGLLPEHSSRYPHEFSGGQRQRIGIARALIMDPDLIIADEPISALDVSIQAQVINLLNDLRHERNLSILFIAHDLSVVKYFCDRIAVMYFGNLVELAPSDLLFKHPLHPYTRSLLSAIPLPDPHYEKNRKRIEYNSLKAHDYSVDKPSFQLVEPNHLVRCNKKELEKYRLEIAEG